MAGKALLRAGGQIASRWFRFDLLYARFASRNETDCQWCSNRGVAARLVHALALHSWHCWCACRPLNSHSHMIAYRPTATSKIHLSYNSHKVGFLTLIVTRGPAASFVVLRLNGAL